MKFLYGTKKNNIDVTSIVYKKCLRSNIIFISKNIDDRIKLFGNTNSNPYICIKNNDIEIIFDTTKNIFIDTNDNTFIDDTDISNNDKINYCLSLFDKHIRLNNIHSKLSIDFGSFTDEYPEQLMVTKYLTGNEKILEIGGNIGRNTLVIASILNINNNNNFVSLESDNNICDQLIHNKEKNKLNFYIENSALSKRKLIQKDWETIPSDIILDGYKSINTIDYISICNKYNINFDTLIADCEGALYYILYDMPEILENINLIIMENDYLDINKKMFVDNILKTYNFKVEYQEAGGWGPCYDRFYEVWIKNLSNIVSNEEINIIRLTEDNRILTHQINDKDNQINNLTHQINDLSNKINDKDNQINNLTHQINDLSNKINDKDNQILELTNQLTNLNNQINKNKIYLLRKK
jgi:hypothetical protein